VNKFTRMAGLVFSAYFLSSCGKGADVAGSIMPDDCGEGDGGKIICATTYRSIAAQAPSYTDKIILINGYLVIDNGVLTLYQDENSYIHGMFRDSVIEIGGSQEEQRKLFEGHGYQYITMSGYFRASPYGASRRHYLGEIRGDIIARDLPTRGVADRQGWQDIAINADDLNSSRGR